MQVGVEEAVLVEHPDDGLRADLGEVPPLLLGQLLRLRGVGVHPVEELHRQHAAAGAGAVDGGEDDVGQVGEVGGEALGVVGLAAQVDLAQGVVAELVHQLPGLEPGDDQLEDAAEHAQQLRVTLERLADARLDDLDDHRLAVQHGGAVGLADGGGAERLRVDVEEELLDRPLEVLLDEADDAGERHHREPVEQVLELVGDVAGEQVLPQAQDLAQLDVGGAEPLEAAPQLHREGLVPQAPRHEGGGQRREQAEQQELEPPPGALRALRPHVRGQPAEEQPEEVLPGDQQPAQEAGRAGLPHDLEAPGAECLRLPGGLFSDCAHTPRAN